MNEPINVFMSAGYVVLFCLALATVFSLPTLDWLIKQLHAHRAGLVAYREESRRVKAAS